MSSFHITTHISAPVERVFDLARSIDLHLDSTEGTGEQVIAGVSSGLIGAGEEVTWRARHFGVWQTHASRITVCDRPQHFVDVMLRGTFRSLEHHHWFDADAEAPEERTIMRDDFAWSSPLGVLGRVADLLVLKRYLYKFLLARNRIIKTTAESEAWRKYLPEP
ncbi:MAG: SRPBCC family protein [Verrucomicrobiota bacterium]